MDNKDIDNLYANLQDEIKKILEDWWQKIKWNVENAATSAAQTATNMPTRRGGNLPWFGHGIRGFLHKLWYGDHPENPNWRATPATENSRKRMTIQEYTNLKNQIEGWMDIFSENDLISATKNDLLNGLLSVMSKYINQAYQLGYTRNTPTAEPTPDAPAPAPAAEKLPEPPVSEPASASEPPVPEPTPDVPPQGQAADMPKRGRGRPALSPEEIERRRVDRIERNKNRNPQPEVGFDTPITPTPPAPEAPQPAKPTVNSDNGLGEKIQETLPYFGMLMREPEDERIKKRQELYDKLGLEHTAGVLRSKGGYDVILGDIIFEMIKNDYLQKKFWNSGERYKRIFGPLKGDLIDKIINHVDKKMESDDSPQTNSNLSGVEAASMSTESIGRTINAYKKLLKENKKANIVIAKSRRLAGKDRISFFIESLRS